MSFQPVVIEGEYREEEHAPALLNPASHCLAEIDFDHHKVHEGDSYEVSIAQDVAGEASLDLLVITPNTTKWLHMFLEGQSEAEGFWYVYRDTNSTGGSGITPLNKNENSINTSGATITSGPTVTTPGTQIRIAKTGSGNKVGGFIRGVGEMILKQNTKYLFRFTNSIAQDKWVSQQLTWYENISRN